MTKQKIGIGQGRFYLTSPSKKLYLVCYSHYLFAVHGKDISRQPKKDLLHGNFCIL